MNVGFPAHHSTAYVASSALNQPNHLQERVSMGSMLGPLIDTIRSLRQIKPFDGLE